MTREQLEAIALETIDRARSARDCFVEIDEPGATVIQAGEYRIAIARPPFSDGLEITAVHPLLRVSFDEYALPEQLKQRLEKRAEGVLVAGPPGAGKTTLRVHSQSSTGEKERLSRRSRSQETCRYQTRLHNIPP